MRFLATRVLRTANAATKAAATSKKTTATKTAKTTEPPPRKRGRPKKSDSDIATTPKTTRTEDPKPGSPKSRGRPAKTAQSEGPTPEEQLNPESTTSKRPNKAEKSKSHKRRTSAEIVRDIQATSQHAPPEKDGPETDSHDKIGDRDSYVLFREQAKRDRMAGMYHPDKDNPTSTFLYNLLDGSKRGASSERTAYTVDVVSPELCDDIIRYMAPTLEQYKGCDLIDIHPGACVWSQKLHEFLQPRRHLLLEPDERYIDHFIRPLLDQKGSTYRHSTMSGAHPKSYWDTYARIFDGELLPKRDPVSAGDPHGRQPNKSLLVVGNLARRYKDYRTLINQVSAASLLINQMAQASQTNSLFHAYGPVRMLLWAPEDTKTAILPDTIIHRHGLSTNLEAAVIPVEVAGIDRYDAEARMAYSPLKMTKRHREVQLDILGARRILDRMRSKKISMPEHRRSILHQHALDFQKFVPEALAAYNPIKLPQGASFEAIVVEHEKKATELLEFLLKYSKRRRTAAMPYTFKWTDESWKLLTDHERQIAGPLADVWGAQIALESKFCTIESELPDRVRADAREKLLKASDKIAQVVEGKFFMSKMPRKMFQTLLNELFGLFRNKPLLAWDRRPFEPLPVQRKEFWPQQPLYLLDMEPRAENLADDLTTAIEANKLRRELNKIMNTHYAAPLPQVLERVGPNGSQDLSAAVPEFTDASQGGRLSINNLASREVTLSQMDKLAKAYIEWPFRPSILEPSLDAEDEILMKQDEAKKGKEEGLDLVDDIESL